MKLAELTGLPPESANGELIQLITDAGLDADTITLQDIRAILATYLQDTLIEAKRELEANFND